MLVANIQFWECLTRVLSAGYIISGKDGGQRKAKGMQKAYDRSLN